MGNSPTNLPNPPAPLVGRKSEILKIKRLLNQKETRLITLTGPGGSGKTRMGLEAAGQSRHVFRDGVFFIDLASIYDPKLVIPAIAQTLNIKAETLRGALRKKQMLLFLDNFEQVIPSAVDIAELLAACPSVKIMVTSREGLRLRGEHELPTLPLKLPNRQRDVTSAEAARYPAIQLFVQRARGANPDFALNDNNASAIVEICRRLDGLPLAIELAAAQSRIIPPEMILARLDQQLKMIPGPRDLPARQKALQATFDWSYELLQINEQLLLKRLSVFSGGAILEGIQEVAGFQNKEKDDLIIELDALANKNMLRQVNQTGDELRFVMLETIRAFALQRLDASEDGQLVRRAHAEHFLTLAKNADEHRWTSEHTRWLDRLEVEKDNLREALQWAVEHSPKRLFLELAGKLWLFWSIRGPLTEGRFWLDLAAKTCEADTDEVKSNLAITVLVGASELAREQGDFEQAIQRKQKTLEISRVCGDKKWEAAMLHDLAIIYAGREECEHSLALAQEAVSLRRKQGNPIGIAHALGALFYAHMCNDDIEAARDVLEESTQIDRETQNHERLATDLTMLIHVAIRQERYDDAQQLFENFIPIARALADQEAIAMGIHAMGILAATKGNILQAALLLGAAEQMATAGGFGIELPGRDWVERLIAEAKAKVAENAWNKEYKAGQTMAKGADTAVNVLDVLAEYLNDSSGSKKTEASPPPAGLTAREMDILRLVAQGLTDLQIAQTLTISPRTVNAHVTSIYHKIGVNSRTAATRFAIERKMV
jgi:predicted ATPase/DNA-binding CsgD family transcriptional regulator